MVFLSSAYIVFCIFLQKAKLALNFGDDTVSQVILDFIFPSFYVSVTYYPLSADFHIQERLVHECMDLGTQTINKKATKT